MGLDVYVGSLTRYYTHDWETVVQKHGREKGMTVEIIRPNEPEDGVVDPVQMRKIVIAWRSGLSEMLGTHISAPLDWDESPESPYFTDRPAWDCYSSLLLWAAYSEHPDLARPVDSVEDWSEDEAYLRSSDRDFQSSFRALLRDTEMWLPSDFRFTFAGEDPAGSKVNVGSVFALRDELKDLNARTWRAGGPALAAWRREGVGPTAPLEAGARFAFAILSDLAAAATQHSLIMKLDY